MSVDQITGFSDDCGCHSTDFTSLVAASTLGCRVCCRSWCLQRMSHVVLHFLLAFTYCRLDDYLS